VPVVELRGFGWRHAGRKAWAVRGVDLTIEAGERVLLLGPSGAGKSTLLAALGGLLPDDSGQREGQVRVNGRAASLFQDPEAQLVMARAGDDVAFGPENLAVPPAQIWPRVDASLAAVGFPYPRDQRTEALSGGEQQRLALAGALALQPDLLLLDEPTANLDPANAGLVRTAVGAALSGSAEPRSGGAAMVLVEHRLAEWLPMIDRVVVLAPGGGVLADAAPERVFAEHAEHLADQGTWVPGGSTPRRPGAGPPGPILLRGEQLGYIFPDATRPALSAVDVDIRAGELLAVTGASGSGKSTLALLLGGLLAPTSGTVRASADLAGRDAARPPHEWRAAALAGRIGSVFQNPEHQFLTGRVVDELTLGQRRTRRRAVASDVDQLLDRLHLTHLAHANPYTLSGGEQRRLSVATALAASPRILVLDEPTFGQDRRTWTELVDLVATVRDEGRAVVAVSHDPDFVAAVADRELELTAGTAHPDPVLVA
jgi:energy-coupling factor transporter ATP-binding protein EcfA2